MFGGAINSPEPIFGRTPEAYVSQWPMDGRDVAHYLDNDFLTGLRMPYGEDILPIQEEGEFVYKASRIDRGWFEKMFTQDFWGRDASGRGTTPFPPDFEHDDVRRAVSAGNVRTFAAVFYPMTSLDDMWVTTGFDSKGEHAVVLKAVRRWSDFMREFENDDEEAPEREE